MSARRERMLIVGLEIILEIALGILLGALCGAILLLALGVVI